jgi:hypothetical protein
MTARPSSARVRAWLESWRADAGLAADDAAALEAYRGSARLEAVRAAATDAGDPDAPGLLRLVASIDALIAAHAGRAEDALALLAEILETPIAPHPLSAAPERFAARLAAAHGDAPAARHFAALAAAREAAFGGGEALAGVGALLVHGELLATLAADGPPPHRIERPPSTFVPYAARESSTRAYVVTVGHQRDRDGARFELHRATLADITDSRDAVPAIADLVLAFEADAAPMLDRLDPERLELRCVFAGSTAFERFDTAAGTLFDVEPVAAEARLYLRLSLPRAWTAAGVAIEDVWSSLESCVLVDPGPP